jgi:hypothetical protein
MTGPVAAAFNLCAKAGRRALAVHKPLVRFARRWQRDRERSARVDAVRAVEQEIAACVARPGILVAGPWLAEVGYEVLYWVPFLRWVTDRFRVPPERLTVVSRGGCQHWYKAMAARHVELFDHVGPAALAALNDERREVEEQGGRKQSSIGTLDTRLLDMIFGRGGYDPAAVLHPSLLFRLFREAWHGNLPLDDLWTRTEYTRMDRPPRPDVAGLPPEYVAVRFYSGTALPDAPWIREALRTIVARLADQAPVVMLDTRDRFDEHDAYAFDGIPNVISAREWMQPRTNLGVQTALIAHARCYVGTCGGLAWLAPFLGVPTVAVYADDSMLAPHLLVARQAGRRVAAADFTTLDLRAFDRVGAAGRSGVREDMHAGR